MNIAHIVPSSGNAFFCENCARDTALIRGLRERGCSAAVVPMYLPFTPDEPGIEADTPVLFGALNLYLRHAVPPYRHAPVFLEKLLDTKAVLGLAARHAGSTRARAAGELTLSMLRGEAGGQTVEISRLVRVLAKDVRPHVVHLSNALLLGLAGPVKRALRVPVVCSLQDEHTWIDAMGEPHAGEAWRTVSEQSAHVDVFVTFSRYYARFMEGRLRLGRKNISVVPMGVDASGLGPSPLPFEPPVIGFLSRMCESSGLDTLAEAFVKIKKVKGLERARLRLAGGYTGDDRKFLRGVRRTLAIHGCESDASFCPGFDKASRMEFFRSLTVFSVPSRETPAFGLSLLEAFAAGVPCVQPATGAYPALVNATGGGITYDPNNADALSERLVSLLRDPERARALGKNGRTSVLRLFRIEDTAETMMKLYEKSLSS